ncbi:cardiomyopathy-associated protein 5 isoform X2 [Anolis carolinensis]|uniref:cardiomyopathy-associated protein 5 isoform X2 n=1 Tax=Anolis carolinensis TaxID=28377 RepID=UPI0004624D02|nr:PREDICTED: cardiomyopathy-associated protein 5 isoform X2 [Anolis carolinensis]|eukprot:XP_008101119.1 PREDICTED: cardiomyopathy-associated protein 5 isoform X2 [Anolis carolinensis]
MTVCFRQPWRRLSRGETTRQEDKMDTDCNSEYEDGSPDASVAEEEEEEAPAERLTSSLKRLNQNEEVKSKLSDAMDANQSEDSGLTWETSSSRCSTSQASETSATSGVSSIENSYVDCPPGKVTCLMEEVKTAQERSSNSPDQTPLYPNRIIGSDGKKNDFPEGSININTQEKELDPADPQSWPLQVQPSKIKDYLVHITQEVVIFEPEEKENTLMRKGELPLKGTVRARIQQITAVLEERNKKIFRRINQKDVPPPSDVIRKPREQPKIFSRQGISVSLRHVERDAPDKKNKKEMISYNLKHVETNSSKAGVSVPYNKDEKPARRSFMPEKVNNATQKLPPISRHSSKQAKKRDTKIQSPIKQTSIPEQASFASSDWQDKTEERSKPALPPGTPTVTTEKLSNHLAETEEQKIQDHSPLTTKVSDTAEESKALLEQEASHLHPTISTESFCYPENGANNQLDSIAIISSEPAIKVTPYPSSIGDIQPKQEQPVSTDVGKQDVELTIPTQMEVKNAALLQPTEDAGKQDIRLYSPETSESVPELAELLPSINRAKNEELGVGYSKTEEAQEQQADSKPLHSLHLAKESDAGETETVPDLAPTTSGREVQEDSRYKTSEEHSGFLQPLYFSGEKTEQKEEEHLGSDLTNQAAPAQISVAISLEPEHPDLPLSKDNAEKQPALLDASELSLPTPDAQREETHQLFATVVRSENELPTISEPIKAPQGSEPLELSHNRGKEVRPDSLVEGFISSEQPPCISSHLTENEEKQKSLPSPLVIARPLPEQLDSILPCPPDQREKQSNLPSASEVVAEGPEASPQPVLAVQSAEAAKAEIQPVSPTEEMAYLSRESDVVIDRKATQLISPLSTEPLRESFVPSQEEEKLKDQSHPCINEKLSLVEKSESHPTISEDEQEGQFHLPAPIPSQLDHLAKSESRNLSVEQNSSESPQLVEETFPLSLPYERDKKDIHPDKSITEPLHPDSEQVVSVLEKQEKQQDEGEKTIQQLSHTVLTKELDLLQSIEKTEINDTPTHLPVIAQDLSQSAHLMETQEDQRVTTDAAALRIPYHKAEAEKYDMAEPESKNTVKQTFQVAATKVEADYSGSGSEGELEAEFPEPGSGKHLNVSLPSPSIGEDHQSHRSVIPGLEEEWPVSLEKESEDPELNSLKTPVSKLEQPSAGPETLESQNYPGDVFNKAPKISPIIPQLVSDKRKDQEIPTKAIGSLASFTEQSYFISQDLKDKEEKNEFHQFPEARQMVTEETEPIRTVPHGESREEMPNCVTTPETELEVPSSILGDVVSKKVNEMPPPELSYAVAERQKKDNLASVLNKSKQMAAGKPDVHDAQPHLFLTGQSEMSNQENEPYPPVASELEDLPLINSIEEVKKQESSPSLPSVEPSAPIHQELWYHKGENQEKITLEAEQSREHDAPLQLPVLQQENLKQLSPVPPSLTKKVEEQEISSQTLTPSVLPALSQSVALDLNEENKQKEIETYPTEEVNGILEEPLSLAAFLLSEANAVHTTFSQTSEKENLDMKPPSEEAGSLTEKSGKAFALPDTNITAKRKSESSTIHFESEILSEKPQDDVTNRICFQEKLEDYSDIQTYPGFIPNELSSVAISEAMDDTNLHKPHPTVGSELLDSAVSKGIGISAEDISKAAEEKCLFNSEGMLKEPKNVSEVTMKEPENYLEKTKESKDHEKVREESILAPELDQGKDTLDIFESDEVVNIHALTDKEEPHVLKSLQHSEKVYSLKTKQLNNSEDTAVDHEPSISGKALKAGKHENRENGSKEHVEQKHVKESTEAEGDISVLPESRGDILKNIDMEYVDNLIDDTSFSQTGKEKSIQEAQRPSDVTKKTLEEARSLVESSEKTLNLSLLERNLDEVSCGIDKKGNIMATHESTLKLLDENKEIDVVTETDKNIEGGLDLAESGVPLFNSEKDISSQSPLTSLPVSAGSPEPPALAFLYRDLHEEVMGASEEDSECSASEEIMSTAVPIPATTHAPYDGTEIFLKKDIPEDYIPNNLEESQKEEVLKDQPINEPAVNQSSILENAHEINKEQNEFVHILTEPYDQTAVVAPREMVENMVDKLTKGPAEIVSNINVGICHPTHAIPFGSRLYGAGASNDDEDSQKEESIPEERGEMLPEETSDEESSPILDYAATVYQNEATVQHEPKDTCFAVGQNQQPIERPIQWTDNGNLKEPVEISQQSLEAFCNINTQSEGEQREDNLISTLEPVSQDTITLDHEHLSDWDTERQAFGESINDDLYEDATEIADLLATEAKAEKSFSEMDYSLLSHDFDTYPLYSIKEEEYSDIEEDLAELMDYEMVTQDDVFQEETSSEVACEELLFDDKKTLDHISNTYEFVNEGEISTYAEEDEFELMDPERLPRNVPEIEVLQKEIDEAQFDTYCYQCKCPISADDKLSGEHKEHDMTNLDTAMTVLKGQLDRYLDVLQERSLKIEGFVSEIEALFNSLEENCKEKEQHLEEQNENIIKTVVGHHDRTAQNFEGVKKTKMEYLYEKMVNFQEYIDTAKETLEAIIKEAEEMDDFTFLTSSEEINKRLLSAVEDILTLEKMPSEFSQFKNYACGTANGDQTLKHIPVPQTPKLQPQDPNSATSTSITVYWTVNEEDVIDFFQVYCMEEYPGSKEQSGLVEEYRVIVKESNCILEDLEPGHSYSVWVMAVNYTGCSFPSDKSTFRTAPRIPVIKAEECTVCWNTATIRWSSSNPETTDSFTLEYCRQYSPEGEGLRSLAGIKRPEVKVHLESNVNYFFYVRAVNVFGTSDQSEAALISTKGTRFHIMKETAHPALQVSPNGTMICFPEDTELPNCSPVLGELLPAQGWHYWETTVNGCAAFKVGICYSSPSHDSIMGQNNVSWCLHHSSKESFVYKVLHNGEMSNVIVTEQPDRIGILLDYNAGRLLFFNAERGQVLSAIRHKFNHPAHPAFVLEQPGVLNLHTGMELPEFVKQS